MSLRIKAFAIHVFLSASVISVFLCFALFIWYPFPYDYFYSPLDVLKIVLLVDLVIGPLFTLIIYDIKKSKNELRRDLSIVAIIQIIAFVWGVHVTYSSRPVFLVFSNQDFYIFAKDDVDLTLLKDKTLLPAFWEGAQKVYVKPPKDSDELTELYSEYYSGEKPMIESRLDRYLPLKKGFDYITQFSIDMTKANKETPEWAALQTFLQKTGKPLSHYVLFPVNGTNKKAILVFERASGKIVNMLEYDY